MKSAQQKRDTSEMLDKLFSKILIMDEVEVRAMTIAALALKDGRSYFEAIELTNNYLVNVEREPISVSEYEAEEEVT